MEAANLAAPAVSQMSISWLRYWEREVIQLHHPVLRLLRSPRKRHTSDLCSLRSRPAFSLITVHRSRVDIRGPKLISTTRNCSIVRIPTRMFLLFMTSTLNIRVRTITLKRFGLDIFENGTGNFDQLPMDLPAGPDYVLGPGDGLNIDLWGSVSQRLHRVVDREGKLSLPEIGSIQVSGHTLGDVQQMVQASLRSQFRTLEADVSLDRLRVIRVYVVGDVQRPGAYDISSLSTPLNALFQAGGPTSRGSMRIVKHFRGNQLVEDVDLYDLLLHGVHSGMQRLESGDTILVPTIGKQVTLEGMVRRPGIYELAGETNLSQVLELAGGVLSSGTLRHIDVDRVEAHQSRTMLRVDMPISNDQAGVVQTSISLQFRMETRLKFRPSCHSLKRRFIWMGTSFVQANTRIGTA